jgi:hypothetical protein
MGVVFCARQIERIEKFIIAPPSCLLVSFSSHHAAVKIVHVARPAFE